MEFIVLVCEHPLDRSTSGGCSGSSNSFDGFDVAILGIRARDEVVLGECDVSCGTVV
jgi:hypothetical protein